MELTKGSAIAKEPRVIGTLHWRIHRSEIFAFEICTATLKPCLVL